MTLNRLRAPLLILLAASLLASPAPAAAAEPTLGDAVTLDDGTVLPVMPAEQIQPTVGADAVPRARYPFDWTPMLK